METIQNYLQKEGFEKETNIIGKLNRWNREDPEGWGGRYASITLNEEGTETEYGFVSWETADQTHDLIEKRKFTGLLTLEEVKKMLKKETPHNELSKIIRIYPMK